MLLQLHEWIEKEYQDPEMVVLYSDLFGPYSPLEIQNWVYRSVLPWMGKIRNCFFTALSIGAVFGLENDQGEKRVLKVYPKVFSKESLDQIHACQKIFFKAGYPAPEILGDLIQVGSSIFGVLMGFIPGEREDGHVVSIRQELAYGLAEFSKIVEKVDFPEISNPFQSKSKARLWPTPHKSTIRLKESSKGAGFLRNRAIKARKKIFEHGLSPQLAHLDWGVKNSRFKDQKLIAVFDWDSLGSMSEAEMVGQAAGQFTADWEIPTKITPSPEEAWAFVEEYQYYRGRKFSRQELEVVSAAADYIVSLIARFEFSGKLRSENSFLSLVESLKDRPLIRVN